jgi:hypothetical protein
VKGNKMKTYTYTGKLEKNEFEEYIVPEKVKAYIKDTDTYDICTIYAEETFARQIIGKLIHYAKSIKESQY